MPLSPKRFPVHLYFRFAVEWLALQGIVFFVRRGTLAQAVRRVHRLARIGRHILRNEWTWTLKNLQLVFGPSLKGETLHGLASLAFEHHFTSYMEGLRCKDISVVVRNIQILRSAHALSRGVVMCSVHLGSWEPAGRALGQTGLPISCVYREAFNPWSDRKFQSVRAEYGVEWIPSTDARAMVRALRDGRILVLMTDLDTEDGVPAGFLGVKAMSPTGAAKLALQFSSPIVPFVALREEVGKATVHIEPAINTDRNTENPLAITNLTERINGVFDRWVVRYAEQYNWLHPRWQSRPDGRRWNKNDSIEIMWAERTAPFHPLDQRVLAALSSFQGRR